VVIVPLGMLRCPLHVLVVFSYKLKIRGVLGAVAVLAVVLASVLALKIHFLWMHMNLLLVIFSDRSLQYLAQSRSHEALMS